MNRALLCLAPLALIVACHAGTPATAPAPTSMPTSRPTSRPASARTPASVAASPSSGPRYLMPTRSGPECDSAVSRALDPAVSGVQPPRPDSLFLPPLPIPRSVAGRGVTVRFLVNVEGRVVGDSLRIEGVGHPAYETRFRRAMLSYRFHPAVLAGCAVPGRYTITLRL